MDLKNEKKNKFISGTSTALICFGMFLIFWLYNFHYELEVPKEPDLGAVAVSMGEPDNGGPELIPIAAESESSSASSEASSEADEQTNDPEAVQTKKASDTKGQSQATPTDKPKPVVDDALAALNKGKSNQKQQNSGDGDKLGPQGDPKGVNGGDPKGQVGGTGGGGTKTSHTFTGRNFNQGSTSNNCNDAGKVVLDVTLLPNGNIRFESVSPLSRASPCLENEAIKSLKNSSFNSSTKPDIVNGTITYVFILK